MSVDPVVIKTRITQNTLLALAAFWLTLLLEDDRSRRRCCRGTKSPAVAKGGRSGDHS